MDEVFPPFADIGAYTLPKERQEKLQPLRQAFTSAHHEYFNFTDGEQPIGWSYGDMRDAETFFMSNTGILPAYRRRGIYSAFLTQFLAYLETLGYERVISNHQTNNRAVLIAKLKAGFNIMSVTLNERWGAQVELIYHIYLDRRRGYERAFSLEER